MSSIQADRTSSTSQNLQQSSLSRHHDDDDDISKCVAFLRHPEVVQFPMSQKTEFLRNQGYTDSQILEAIQRSQGALAASTNASNDHTQIPITDSSMPDKQPSSSSTSRSVWPFLVPALAIGSSVIGYQCASNHLDSTNALHRGSITAQTRRHDSQSSNVPTQQRHVEGSSFLQVVKEKGSFCLQELTKALLGDDYDEEPSQSQTVNSFGNHVSPMQTHSEAGQTTWNPENHLSPHPIASGAIPSQRSSSQQSAAVNDVYRNIPIADGRGNESYWLERNVKDLQREVASLRGELKALTENISELRNSTASSTISQQKSIIRGSENSQTDIDNKKDHPPARDSTPEKSKRNDGSETSESNHRETCAVSDSPQKNKLTDTNQENPKENQVIDIMPEKLKLKVRALSENAEQVLNECIHMNSNEVFTKQVGMLMVLFNNLLRDPSSRQYHRIRLSPSSSLHNITSIKGFSLVLRASGFVPAEAEEIEEPDMETFRDTLKPHAPTEPQEDHIMNWKWSWADADKQITEVLVRMENRDSKDCRPRDVLRNMVNRIRGTLRKDQGETREAAVAPGNDKGSRGGGNTKLESGKREGPKFPLSFNEVIDTVRKGGTPSDVEEIPNSLSKEARKYANSEEMLKSASESPSKPYGRKVT